MSPYIFILCGEVFTGLCKLAERNSMLSGVRVAKGSPRINHLLFVDDTMFFCYATPTSVQTSRISSTNTKLSLVRNQQQQVINNIQL